MPTAASRSTHAVSSPKFWRRYGSGVSTGRTLGSFSTEQAAPRGTGPRMNTDTVTSSHGSFPARARARLRAGARHRAAAASAAPPPDPLVFDTWVPGPCSPNGQPQGQCPPGELFRVRLVPVAEGLTNPRHVAFTPNGDLLIAELARPRTAVVRGGKLRRSRSRAGPRRASRPRTCRPSPCIRSSPRTVSSTSTT